MREIAASWPKQLVFEHMILDAGVLEKFRTSVKKCYDLDNRLAEDVAEYDTAVQRMSIIHGQAMWFMRMKYDIEDNPAVSKFFAHYPELPQTHAYGLNAYKIPFPMPFKRFRSAIWIDEVEINGTKSKRFFRQPLTADGYPFTTCWTFPCSYNWEYYYGDYEAVCAEREKDEVL